MGGQFNDVEDALSIANLTQVGSRSHSGYSSDRLEYPPIGKLTPNARKVAKPVSLKLQQRAHRRLYFKVLIN